MVLTSLISASPGIISRVKGLIPVGTTVGAHEDANDLGFRLGADPGASIDSQGSARLNRQGVNLCTRQANFYPYPAAIHGFVDAIRRPGVNDQGVIRRDLQPKIDEWMVVRTQVTPPSVER